MNEEIINEYDLIFSLGGSCAAACQLKQRGLRFAALPLDYAFFKNETKMLSKLAECFDTNFENFLLKENLQELQGNERGDDHDGKIQYIDMYTKYRWINHFNRRVEEPGAYEETKKIIDRRIKRWVTFLSKSKKVLAIITNATEIPLDEFNILTNCLKKHFKNLEIEYRYIKFESDKEDIYTVDNVTVVKVHKKQDFYDFARTNYYWSFLDNCKLTNTLVNNQAPSKTQSKIYFNCKRRFKIMGYALLLAFIQIPVLDYFVKDKRMILNKILKYWR